MSVLWWSATYIYHLQAVYKNLKDAILGISLPFEFEGDCVSLDIPEEGMVKGDWSITPLVPLMVSPPLLCDVVALGLLRTAVH